MKGICFRTLRYILLLIFMTFVQQPTVTAQLLHGVPYIGQQQIPSLKKDIQNSRSINEKVTALNLLGAHYLHNPHPRTANLNSALRIAKEAAAISTKAGLEKSFNDAQSLIAFTYLRKRKLDSAEIVLPMVNDSTRFKILLGMANYVRIFGMGSKFSRLKKAMDITLQAQQISRKLNDTLKNIMVMREIASIHSETQQPDSEKELLNVISLFQGIGYPNLHYTYYELFGLAFLQGNEDKVLYYSEQALKSMTLTKDSAGAGDLLLIHGMILAKLSDHAKSVKYIKLAIDQYKFQYGDGNINLALRYLIDELVKLKQPGEADKMITQLFREYPPDNLADSLQWLNTVGSFYRLTKNFAKAERYYNMDMNIRKKHNYPIPYHTIGQLYVESGNFVKAKYFLEKALQLVDSTTSTRARGHLHYCLFLADSATGNYLSAIRHLSQNKRYDDTLLTRSKVEAIEKYQAQFETAKKEDSLKFKDQHISLLTQANNLQKENLQQADLIKNVTIAGIVLVLGIAALLYRQYRNKQKSNRLISQKNEQLQHVVTEKEWLLREVHHRVKNNLHTVICLLESQAAYLSNDALKAIQDSQHRIYAMSLIHQKLYQTEDIKTIDMGIYLPQFIQYLNDSFGASRHIHFALNIEGIKLSVSQAIPIALIINEAVTNSIKYAFPNERKGEISITLIRDGQQVKLVAADNGIGIDPKIKDQELNSLGIELIKGLTKDLIGNLTIENQDGTTITITFKHDTIFENAINVPLQIQQEVYA